MCPVVAYTTYITSLREQTGDIIMFAQFEEGNIWTKISNDSESSDESNNKLIMMSEQDMGAMNSGDDSDHDYISTEMLEYIRDRSQTLPNIKRREARYKIRDRIRQKTTRMERSVKS